MLTYCFELLSLKKSTTLNVYTPTVQKKSSLGGFAVVNEDGSIISYCRSDNKATVFTLEAMAIWNSLEIIENSRWSNSTIFSDSHNVLMTLDNIFHPKKSSQIIILLKNKLEKMYNKGQFVKLIWIPSHCGIIGNELADFYAKRASNQGIDTQLKIPSDLNLHWKNYLFSEFNNWCVQSSYSKDTLYFELYFQIKKRPWFWYYNIPRKAVVCINRIRSGHTSLRESLYKFNIVDDPFCPDCESIENINHILWQCPRFETQSSILTIENSFKSTTLFLCQWKLFYLICN